ncbi:Gfo/Idh/MocA family protein [Planctomicrobium sp. SH661]|uniref:Gfo/Idh/MocA family protein n=1 Tax=Planctomicrobium sp. SH661 TaxID=3448124 RepID=UPI003F5BF562
MPAAPESLIFDRRRFLNASLIATGTILAGRPLQAAEKSWRVGVSGHTGRGNYGHGLDNFWLTMPQMQVVGFADANEAGRNKEQMRLPGVPAYPDYRTMLAETRPEIVAVAPRWIDEHRDMIFAAIESGARGIYCEKPFCRTPAEADEIVAACENSGCRIAIAFRNHYHPAVPAVKAALQDGTIGELKEIRGWGKEDHRGGCLDLWVLGSHQLDMTRVLVGEAISCTAVIRKGDRPAVPSDLHEGDEGVGLIAGDSLQARFEMASGIPFHFQSVRNRGNTPDQFKLKFIGTKGLIEVQFDLQPLAHFIPGDPTKAGSTPPPRIPITSNGVGKPETIENLAERVADHHIPAEDLIAAITEQRPALCSELDGRANVEMIHAVFASHVAGGKTIPLPLQDRAHPFTTWKE